MSVVRDRAVAVQVPANGVELRQVGDVDQPIVVAVVVRPPLHAAHVLEDGVVIVRAEVPGVVPPGGVAVVVVRVVQVQVPVGVDAGVARWELEGGGGPARQAVGLARVDEVVVGVGSGTVVFLADAE